MEEAPGPGNAIGPHIIIAYDDHQEIQILTQYPFHPQEIIEMLKVAQAKMELLQVRIALQEVKKQQGQPQILVAHQKIDNLRV